MRARAVGLWRGQGLGQGYRDRGLRLENSCFWTLDFSLINKLPLTLY